MFLAMVTCQCSAIVRPSNVPSEPIKAPGPVLTGIDVLERDAYQLLSGSTVGLVSNQTSINRDGAAVAELLHHSAHVKLAALFSPEHGPRGRLDEENISSGVDPVTGHIIHSLYGETRKPTAQMLNGIDTLVFDTQDIGTRFYTYISTMVLAMESAAEHGIRFVVLDRPNPIGGVTVSGPVLDEGQESFVGIHTIPVRHGMTTGELARMIKAEKELSLDLEIVRLEGWDRDMFFSATGLPWVNPSPNMRNLRQALLYPGIGLLETTNLSVGRGTDTPFEVLGAPWLDGRKLAGRLARSGLAGTAFVPIEFTPDSSKFAGQRCGGINILVTDWQRFQPVKTGLEIARVLRLMYPQQWDASRFPRLLGHEETFRVLSTGGSLTDIEQAFARGLVDFRLRREPFLLYR